MICAGPDGRGVLYAKQCVRVLPAALYCEVWCVLSLMSCQFDVSLILQEG